MQQEEEEQMDHRLNQYDTTLFNKAANGLMIEIAKQKKERQQQNKELIC